MRAIFPAWVWVSSAMMLLGCAAGSRVAVQDVISDQVHSDALSMDVPAGLDADFLRGDLAGDHSEIPGPGDSIPDQDSLDVRPDVADVLPDSADVVEECLALPPMAPFWVEILFDDGYWFDQEFKYAGLAHVTRAEADTTAVGVSGAMARLYLEGIEIWVTVKYQFPGDQRLPVVAGEEVDVEIWIQRPWWQTTYLMIRDVDSGPRAVVFSGADLISAAQGQAVWFSQENTECPGVDHPCGMETSPPVLLAWNFSAAMMPVYQGEVSTVVLPGGHFKLYGVSSRKTDSNDQCMDYPYQWVDLLVLGNHRHNQCRCEDHDDCTRAHRCETEVHRCVPDLCADLDCAGPCDSYVGFCHPSDVPPSTPCQSSQDCGVGPDCNMVCNTVLGWCQRSDCCLMDCAHGCSPLLGACYGCLSDCDCLGDQTCRLRDRTCISCEPAKMNFTQANEPLFEYFLICIPKDDAAKVSAVKDIVPEMTCNSGAILANCAGETPCMGQFLGPWPRDGSKILSDEDWDRLCRLSRLPFVSKILGGHYL